MLGFLELFFFFFFSSRRRHTRLQGDWSSDVCSSDLSGTGDVAKAEALVEATGGIFGPHAETKAKPAASGLADQRAHELLANALAARIRFHADRHLRSLLVRVGGRHLFGGKPPCPGCTNDFAVLFGDEPEIPRSLPADEIFGYARNRLRHLCIGFIGRHREKIPQYLEVILDSRTDHKIGHRTCSLFIYSATALAGAASRSTASAAAATRPPAKKRG